MSSATAIPAVHRHLSNLGAVFTAIAIIVCVQWISNTAIDTSASKDNERPTPLLSNEIKSTTGFNTLEEAAAAPVPEVDSTFIMPVDLQKLLNQGKFDSVRSHLLRLAMQAVNDNDTHALASTMALLGLAALAEPDTDSGAVYLNEALALFDELDDPLGAASVNLHLGRLHIIERRRARRAALAYDTSLLARWKIANGMFTEAEPSLVNAIEENLELNRHGAAAIDYETLFQGYLAQGNTLEAKSAALAAAQLHASSGRIQQAQQLVRQLNDSGMFSVDSESLNGILQHLHGEYEASINQIGRARDFNRLYNHFIAEKDPVRAWHFRLQADESLRKASKRARYRRQTGVLVLLYNSNDNMKAAITSLERAQVTFIHHAADSLHTQALQLMKEVY